MSGYWNVISKIPGVKKTVKKTFEYVVPKITKNLTTKRAIQDKVVKAVDEGTAKGLAGRTASQSLKQSMSKTKKDSSKKLKDISYKYDEIVNKKIAADKKLAKQRTFGDGAAIAGAVGAHEGAKKKWPKYKTVMESDITIKDGKLGLKKKKKK